MFLCIVTVPYIDTIRVKTNFISHWLVRHTVVHQLQVRLGHTPKSGKEWGVYLTLLDWLTDPTVGPNASPLMGCLPRDCVCHTVYYWT